MSYILDALKKSEQERGHGSVPGVQTIHSSSLNYHNEKKPVWPVLLFTLVFINLAVLGYFILTKQEVIVSSQQQTTNDIAANPVIVTNTPEAQQESITPAVAQISLEQNTQLSQAKIQNNEVVSDETVMSPPLEQATAIEQHTKAISLHDIPQNVRQHIPAMEFSAHIYSTNASRRSLMINGRFMEEGDSITNDLVLSEITSDGAIFNFQGYRFKASVLSGWDIN